MVQQPVRDDQQIFRDLYNAQSIEVLKGPSALTFGRGAGGGLVNRTLKEADGTRIYEGTLQTGSYWDRRATLDVGQAINDNVAARLNMMYEGSETFRDFGQLERYGVNPTVTLKPGDATKVKLSYEYYHDERTADRGNLSQALSAVAPSSTRFNPAAPFAPGGDLTAYLGSPLNVARALQRTSMRTLRPTAQPASCSPCASAVMRACDSGSSDVVNISTASRRTRSCARAASGHAAAPPRSVMNSRRRIIRSPRRRLRAAMAAR